MGTLMSFASNENTRPGLGLDGCPVAVVAGTGFGRCGTRLQLASNHPRLGKKHLEDRPLALTGILTLRNGMAETLPGPLRTFSGCQCVDGLGGSRIDPIGPLLPFSRRAGSGA